MKRIDIVGQNYFGSWDKTRTACRAIIIQNDKILLSYENKTNQWMLPGGGVEDNESDESCCIREVKEETGKVITVSDCKLEIAEFYEGWKFVSRYFLGEIVGEAQTKLTKREAEVGMEPRWIEIDTIIDIFSRYRDYAEVDEMRRGIYQREYIALCEIIGKK